ncbi:hypothetical protein CCR97_24400 [Rhodoplanes elegans]|nr:hypothetical protein [Rhodoplanes elegans]
MVLLSFAAMSTPAEARKIRFSFGASKSVAAPAPVPAPVQTRPAAMRPAVYVGVSPRAGVASGAAGAAPVRAASADGGELARLAGPDAAKPASAGKPPVDERVARRKAWHDFCQPKLSAPDRYGIEHYVYAHDGCQFGRTE